MAVRVTTMSGLFGADWQTLTLEELRQAAEPVFPAGTADPDHFVNPSPFSRIYLASSSGEIVNGSGGWDYMLAAEGNDTVNGYGGNDFINGGLGADSILGGAGDDIIIYDPTDLYVHGGSGIDTLLLRDRGTLLPGTGGLVSIERIDLGNSFRDNVQFTLSQLMSYRDKELRIVGEAGDIIDFATTSTAVFVDTVVENGVSFDRYRIGKTTFGVQQGVTVQSGLAPEFASIATFGIARRDARRRPCCGR